MGDLMSATEVLARLRIDAASEDFEGAQLGPVAVRKLLKHIAALESDRWRQLCRIHSNRADALRRECDELTAEVERMRAELKGPDRHETWEDAALAERVRRVAADAERDDLAARLAEIERAEPVAWQSRFTDGGGWGYCSEQHARMVMDAPHEWPGYEVRALFARPAPAAAPERAEPDHLEDARGMVCTTSGRVFGGGDMCHFLCGSSNMCDSPTPCEHQRPRSCRTCRPDGCSDSTSCPRGER